MRFRFHVDKTKSIIACYHDYYSVIWMTQTNPDFSEVINSFDEHNLSYALLSFDFSRVQFSMSLLITITSLVLL